MRLNPMPRFGTKSLLLAFAALALWFSTFSAYAAAGDVRKAILLTVLVASSYAAIRFEGRRRAFWGGFSVTMLIHGFTTVLDRVPTRHVFGYAPNLDWCGHATNKLLPMITTESSPFYHQIYRATEATFAAVWILAVSAAIGWICAYIYDQRSTK